MTLKLSASQIMNELDLSRSTFYYLLKNGQIQLEQTSSGRYIWNEETCNTLKQAILNKEQVENRIDLPIYKTTQINNRRYLGNKYKLLDFIKGVVEKECTGINTIADIFAGTGAVTSAFVDKKIITNDFLYFNYVCHVAWFGSEKYDKEKLIEHINFYNHYITQEENYMSETFADTFFSKEDCRKIGYIREDIEELYKHKSINERERYC